MSIKYINELILDIYIKKENIKNINFNNKEDIEKYLKKLFKLLKNKYDITIEGFYNITIYKDKNYGIVLHLEKEELEYYNYFKNQVDMRLSTVNTNFLYKVNDIPLSILPKIEIINKDNNMFIKIKNKLTKLEMMNLIENSVITYEMIN